MKVQEMRELSADELKARIAETRKELVGLRFQHTLRKLESPAKLATTRRTLSRLLTVEAEKARQN
ncbi:MAG: 50S ribosomal protein L29 [Candidatus Obscuribacterales bacterium]|nr:50S ribosomal protein L29 [Candidatus Melainabacteria bacterium]